MTRIPRRCAPLIALSLLLAACGGAADDTAATDDAASQTTSASDAAAASEAPSDAPSEAPSDAPSGTTSSATPSAQPSTPGGSDAGPVQVGTYPVTIPHDAGEAIIDARPQAIVSLSPTATEMLFAIGAGDQVVAVDSLSNFPEEAPTTELSAFEPNVEAILELDPDLVVSSSDTNDLVASLTAADVPVIVEDAATTFEASYEQIRALGLATGNPDGAEETVAEMQEGLDAAAASAPGGTDGLTYYHELDPNLFTATSDTFIGDVYGLFGLENIADEADPEAGDYPQLSPESVVEADPDLVFLADTICCEVTPESFGQRPGFADLTAVTNGAVVGLDDDIASRWGPRVVEFAEAVAAALSDLEATLGELEPAA